MTKLMQDLWAESAKFSSIEKDRLNWMFDQITGPYREEYRPIWLTHAQAEVRVSKAPPPKLPSREEMIARIESRGRVAMEMFLSQWMMPDGRSLGEWNGKELKEHSYELASKAREMNKKSVFYRRLSEMCGERNVADAVAPEAAEKLWQNVENTITRVA